MLPYSTRRRDVTTACHRMHTTTSVNTQNTQRRSRKNNNTIKHQTQQADDGQNVLLVTMTTGALCILSGLEIGSMAACDVRWLPGFPMLKTQCVC